LVRAARMRDEYELDEIQPYANAPAAPGRRGSARARRNAAAWRGYVASAAIVGRVDHSPDPRVRFRRVATRGERAALTFLVLLNATAAMVFIGWLLLPQHIPAAGVVGLDGWKIDVARFAFCVVVIVEVIRLVQNFAVWVFTFFAKDPVPKALPAGLRVAMLTTIVPSKEPLHVVERTLLAMKRVRYRGQVDVWILDEGDDPAVKAMASRLGVYHFSRKGIPELNTRKGAFRAKTKSGNHNSWRVQHEQDYDVVAQMDPDHVPLPVFLERTLGYFRDPDVAFVVAPQVYGNMYDTWVAHGASVQQYLFSGIVERGGNGLSAPLLIGTNHLYRPAAWRQIGGYQDSIIEDHLTSMRIEGTINPSTGRRWKGVYTPDVLAIGEAPTSWTDYFNQQKRWSYGIWEILLKRRLRKGIRLKLRQRLMYALVQFYYPSVGATVLLGTIATSIYLLLGITALHVDGRTWVTLWSLNMASWLVLWLWLRRFNLAAHERRELGLPGMLLALFAGPVYVAAGARALLRLPLRYVVTAKGKLKTEDSAHTFALHCFWAVVAALLLAISFRLHHDLVALRVWAGLAFVIGFGPPFIATLARLARLGRRSRAEQLDRDDLDGHAWQRDMVRDFSSPDLIPLFERAARQSEALETIDASRGSGPDSAADFSRGRAAVLEYERAARRAGRDPDEWDRGRRAGRRRYPSDGMPPAVQSANGRRAGQWPEERQQQWQRTESRPDDSWPDDREARHRRPAEWQPEVRAEPPGPREGARVRPRHRAPDDAAPAAQNGNRNGWHRPPPPEARDLRTEDRNPSWRE
jgi:cellulose synthase (UDP-forming)